MSKPTTSVLISVYKSEEPQFFALALRSIYDEQTVKPDQVVIVADGGLTRELKPVFGVSPVHTGALFRKSNNGLAEAAW